MPNGSRNPWIDLNEADRRFPSQKTFPVETSTKRIPDELEIAKHRAQPVAGLSTSRVNAMVMKDVIGGGTLQEVKAELRHKGRLEGEHRKRALSKYGDYRKLDTLRSGGDPDEAKPVQFQCRDPQQTEMSNDQQLMERFQRDGQLKGRLQTYERHDFLGDVDDRKWQTTRNCAPRKDPASIMKAAGANSNMIMSGIRAFRGKDEILHTEGSMFYKELEKAEELAIQAKFKSRSCPPKPNAITKSISASIIGSENENVFRETGDMSPRHMLPHSGRTGRSWRNLDKRVTCPSGGDETPSEAWLDPDYVKAWKFMATNDTMKRSKDDDNMSEKESSFGGDANINVKQLGEPRPAFTTRKGREVRRGGERLHRPREDSLDVEKHITYGDEKAAQFKAKSLEDQQYKDKLKSTWSRAIPTQSRASTPRSARSSKSSSITSARSLFRPATAR